MSSQSNMEMDGDVWLLDCRVAMHHTSNARLLDSIVGSVPSLRVDDDNNRITGAVRGSVRTERFQVLEVSYVEGGESSRNVISVAQLAHRHGLITIFEPTCAYVRDPATEEEVGRACLRDGVYVLDYLRIDQPLVDIIIDANLHPDTGRTDELQSSSVVVCEVVTHEIHERESWFGMSRSDRAMDPTVDVFPMLSPYEQQHANPTKEFYMDSGVGHHVTWNGDVMKACHEALQIKPPIGSVNIMSAASTRAVSDLSDSLRVGGIGYIASKGGSLDRVLFVPDSPANLVSVSQITKDYSVRVVFHREEFWIEKLETKDRIGHGQQVGMNYVVAVLDVGAGNIWVLDTFAWHHYTSNRNMLYDFQETAQDLKTAGAGQLQIHGHGLVMNERFKVPGVRYIAGDTKNVVSVAQLADDHGLVTVFQPKSCYVMDQETEQIVGKGRLLKTKYVLDYLQIDLQKNKTEEPEDQEDNGSRHGGNGSEEQEEKDEEGGGTRGGDTGKGGSGHGQNEGFGCAEGGEKETSEEAEEGGDNRENKDEDKNSGGKGDRGGGKKDNNEDGSRKQENKDVDIFGLARFDRIPGPGERDSCRRYHIDNNEVCARAAPAMESQNDQRPRHFIMDSGACFHVTWDSTIINSYPQKLGITLPTRSISGVSGHDITVEYSGYIDNDTTKLDGVLFVPKTAMNLVSIAQLSDQYNLIVVMGRGIIVYKDGNMSQKIGHGSRFGQHYILDYFRPGYLYVENPNTWHCRRQHNSHNPNPDRTLTDGMFVRILPGVTLQVAGEGNIHNNNRIQLEKGVPVGELKKDLRRQVRDRLVSEERNLRSLANTGAPDWWVVDFARPLQGMGVLWLLVEELDRQLTTAAAPAFARLQGNEPQIQQLATHIRAMSMPLPQDWITLVRGHFEQMYKMELDLINRMGMADRTQNSGHTQLHQSSTHLWQQMINEGSLLLRSGTLCTHLQRMGMQGNTAQLLVNQLRDPHIKAAGEFTRHLQALCVPQPLIDELALQLTAAPDHKVVESWIEDIAGKVACEAPLLPDSTFQITIGKYVVVAGGRMDVHGVNYLDNWPTCPRVRLSLCPGVSSNSYQWALTLVDQSV